MKRTVAWIAVAALVLGCANNGMTPPPAAAAADNLAPSAEPVKNQRGLAPAVMADKTPPIDGTLKGPLWEKCPPMVLGECTGEGPGPAATTARVLFTPTHLCVAWDCAQSDTDALKTAVGERDGDVWQDDCVELFVTGDQRQGYFHFVVNPKGTIFDAKFDERSRDDKSWNSSATAAATVEKGKRYVVTMSIPLAELGAYVGQGQTWIVNLNRTRPGPTPSQPAGEWSWAIMGSTSYHQVRDYGQIVGVDVPKRSDGVTRTTTPPPPPPTYEKGKAAGGVTVYRQIAEMDIPKTAEGTSKAVDLLIRGSDGLKVAFLARGGDGIDSVPFNMGDERSNDNTTSKAYRTVGPNWRPLVYYVDRFRYNAQVESTIGKEADFRNLRFHSNGDAKDGAVLAIRNFAIYRGEDATPPSGPAGLKGYSAKGGIFLSWAPAVDNVAPATYVISRAPAGGKSAGRFEKVGQSHRPEFVDPNPPEGKLAYRVLAVDFQDNIGPWSEAITVDNPLKHFPAEASVYVKDRPGYAESVRKVQAAGVGKVRKGVVLMFGDSLTYATNYRTSVEGALGRYRVQARGYPGQRTGFGKNKIDADLEAENPEYCMILLGTNNGKSDKDIAAAMDDLLAIAKSCQARGTVAIIGTIPPRGFSDPDSKPEARYNAAVAEMCRKNNLPCCYLFEHFQSLPDRKKLLAGDGVHWMGQGFDEAGAAWGKVMEQVTWVVLDQPQP